MKKQKNYNQEIDKEISKLSFLIAISIFVAIGYFLTHTKEIIMLKRDSVITVIIFISGVSIYAIINFLLKNKKENEFPDIEIKLNDIKYPKNEYIDKEQKNIKEKQQQEASEKQKQSRSNFINKFYGKAKTKEQKIRKGKEYEYDVKCFLERRGYEVYPNGYINGVKDGGIDIIAYKGDEAVLAQCKNWINPPKQDIIKKFIADADLFINKNKRKFKSKRIRKVFFTSCRQMDYGTKIFLEEYNQYNQIKIEYIIYDLITNIRS